MTPRRSRKPSGSGSGAAPGSPLSQFGVSRRSESQRSERQRSPTRPRSSTTWSWPAAREVAAQREPGLAGADDDRVDVHAQRERVRSAEGDVAEEVVRAVGAERVHERAGPDVAVRARQRRAVEVAGAAGQRERAVDDPRRRLVDERLRRLALGEQRDDLLVGAVVRGFAAWCSSISAAARESTARDAARSIADSATSMRARGVVADALAVGAARANAASAMPSDADAWNSPDGQVALEVGHRLADGEAAAQGRRRQLDALEA